MGTKLTGKQGDTPGRRPGDESGAKAVRSRAAVARKLLAQKMTLSQEQLEQIQAQFPEVRGEMEREAFMTLVMMAKAATGDVSAYNAVLNSAYGPAKREEELEGKTTINIRIE